jgi:hypothetical protein
MPKSLARLMLPLAALLMTALQGCQIPITETEAAKTAQSIGHIRPSKADTCDTQRQIAAQSSRIETTIQGKEIVYKADCSSVPKPPVKSS